MSPIETIFKSLIGRWHLHRIITEQGVVTGTAGFVSTGTNYLAYHETGYFTCQAANTYRVSRDYYYCYAPERDQVLVYLAAVRQ